MIIAMMLAAVPGVAATEARELWATVDGARYRVVVDGDTFTAFKKKALVRHTPQERDLARRAVRIATGCEPVDEFPKDARLRGKLDCSKRPAN